MLIKCKQTEKYPIFISGPFQRQHWVSTNLPLGRSWALYCKSDKQSPKVEAARTQQKYTEPVLTKAAKKDVRRKQLGSQQEQYVSNHLQVNKYTESARDEIEHAFIAWQGLSGIRVQSFAKETLNFENIWTTAWVKIAWILFLEGNVSAQHTHSIVHQRETRMPAHWL